jgi:hypothetical protein
MAVTQGIKFLYQFTVGELDLVNPGSNVISVTSTATGDHDKKNLTTAPLRETWRSASAATPQVIVIKANDTTVAPDVFSLLNHNLTSNAVVNLKGSTSTNFTGAGFSINFPYGKNNMILSQAIGLPYPYYQITIQDAGNPCGYIEIGRIVAGQSFTFMNNEDMAENFSVKREDLSYQMKTEGFFRASNERVKVSGLNLTFPSLQTTTGNNANYLGLSTMVEFVGTTLPFLTIVDPFDVYFKNAWGQLNQLPTEQYTVNRYVTLTLDIQQVY